MRNISPVVKDDDIEKKKHTHSVSDISDFPEIPDETAISGMGFTKNSGDYSKPNGGIPKSDLASAVQTSLSKADTALQEHQSLAEYVKADDARLTDARPANGGNAETVNGHTINADVPANAVFTDTTYEPATTSSDGLMSAADKKKLYGVEEGANKTAIDTALSSTSTNPVQNKVINAALNNKADITAIPTSLPANDVYDWAKQPTKPTYTASEVGADASGSANTALTEAKAYTDTEIAGLINGAPTTLDTLGEIADAMKSNQTVIEALNTAIGTKANTSDLTAHTGNTSNPHNVTKTQVGLGNVPNVTTNDQTPSYTESSSLTKLTSGEKLSVAFGKISKAITDLISHIGDSVKHITNTERANWNAAKTHADSAHAPSNAQANVIETVKVNGTALTPSSKAVNITVPTVGNGTITITQNGTTKGTFTTNQSGNTTIALDDNNTVYTHPTYTAKNSGLYKVTVDGTGHVSAATAVTKSDITALGIPASDTNTHYTSKNVVGSSNATSNTTSALTNGNVYLNSVENGAVTSAHKISGSGATTVTTDTSGNIIISSTDTNTNTTYTAGTGLSLSGTTFNHSNSVTAGTAQGDANKTLTFGGTFTIPTVTYDAQGHITAKGTTTMTMPANPNTDTKVTNTLATTTKAYVTGTTSATTNTGTQVFDTGVYLDTTAGMLTATTFKGALSGNAASATALTTSAGSATQPVYFSGGKPVACSYTLGKSVPSNAVFTDTTYPVYVKYIDGNYTTAYRTQAKGNSSEGGFITALRCNAASISGAPQFGSGIGWGLSDTHGYLYVNYATAEAYIGGGNEDKLNWVKPISLNGHTHNYAGSSSAGGAATTALTCTGNSATASKLTSSSYITISITTSDWLTNSSGGYVCTKTLSSAMPYMNFNFDVVLSTDQSAAKLQIEAWNCIIADGNITQTTSSGSTTAFTFYAFTNKPSVAITVGIQGVS